MTQEDVLIPKEGEQQMGQSLFDRFGRRIPYEGMRVYNVVSRRYFQTIQPPVASGLIYSALKKHLQTQAFPFTANQFLREWFGVLEALQANVQMSNLTRGVYVPFICPPRVSEETRRSEIKRFVTATGQAHKEMYPQNEFYDLSKDLPTEGVAFAQNSRYERFEEARNNAWVVGVWFPVCLSEFDIASQRNQMLTLPETIDYGKRGAHIVLSGVVEAAAGLIGCPELFVNSNEYPHILTCSALQEVDENILYSFEADGTPDGYNLVFRWRTNVLTTLQSGGFATQLSEQWAGGLTVFTTLE